LGKKGVEKQNKNVILAYLSARMLISLVLHHEQSWN